MGFLELTFSFFIFLFFFTLFSLTLLTSRMSQSTFYYTDVTRRRELGHVKACHRHFGDDTIQTDKDNSDVALDAF